MQRRYTRLLRLNLQITGGLVIFALVWFAQNAHLAWADTPSVACTSLQATFSSDKTHYIFTAMASGENGSIIGYRFNFGDHQSYIFEFAAVGPRQDHHHATVVHTYISQGVYTATAYIETEADNRTTSTTSSACRIVIANGPTELLNTGAGNTPELFGIAAVTGLLMYQMALRLRRTPK